MRTITYYVTIVQNKACKYKILRKINLNGKDIFKWKNKYKRQQYLDLKKFRKRNSTLFYLQVQVATSSSVNQTSTPDCHKWYIKVPLRLGKRIQNKIIQYLNIITGNTMIKYDKVQYRHIIQYKNIEKYKYCTT